MYGLLLLLASESSTGDKNPGRIGCLGLDEIGAPFIIAYKLSSSQVVAGLAFHSHHRSFSRSQATPIRLSILQDYLA